MDLGTGVLIVLSIACGLLALGAAGSTEQQIQKAEQRVFEKASSEEIMGLRKSFRVTFIMGLLVLVLALTFSFWAGTRI